MSTRPTIPSKIKRQTLLEAGHRCAIPTCRFPTTEIAHIMPWSKVKVHKFENLIALCPNCHTRFDKNEIDKKSILAYKKKLIFISDRYTKYELNVLDYLVKNKKAIINGFLSVINLIDNGLIRNENLISSFTYDDQSEEVLQFVAVLTNEGNEFIKQWIDPENQSIEY